MKKIFTLIAMSLMAVGVNAQESYLVNADTNPADYEGTWYKKATTSVQLYYGLDQGWTTNKSLNSDEGNYSFDVFTRYVSGGQNPKDGETPGSGSNFSLTNHKSPKSGTYYGFKPSAAGAIEAGIILNKDKNFYVIDGDGIALSDYDIKDYEGKTVALDADSKASEKIYGKVTFNVEADKEYYIFCTGSKLGFMGFKFSTTAATIDPATTAAAKTAIDAANPNTQGGGGSEGGSGTSEELKSGGDKDTDYVGKSYTIPGEYIAGSGGGKVGDMSGSGIKLRTNHGNEIIFNVNSGYAITSFTLIGAGNNSAGNISAIKATVDGGDNLLASAVSFENGGKNASNSSKIELTNINAQDNITIGFDYSSDFDGNKQINSTLIVEYKDASGVKVVKTENIDLNAPAYNLAGQKVAESYKGVVIQNGKKVVMK